ncbi:EpsG family protein [Marseilla massiliensis]|uniref:EpsG family protein n=1 Tax=Marseilla massiliensis TaxID=1841864 RepID=A0A938WTF0_9BACT|nr:EpsG family protein [Marseilla massiliensis]MBM6673386.1 EpsG family protein [Marseilla massiliensis]
MIIILLIAIIGFMGIYYLKNPNRIKEKRTYLLLGLLWCILPAIRTENVGTDTYNYIDFFLHPVSGYNGRDNVEIAFEYWNILVRWISLNKYWYIFVSAILATSIKFWFIQKISLKPLLTLFLMSSIVFLEPFLFIEYGGMRQSISISFYLLFFYALISQYKWYYIFLWGFLSFNFHNSSLFPILVTILLYLIKHQFSKNTYFLLIIISFAIGNIAVAYLQNFFLYLSYFIGIGQMVYFENIGQTELITGYEYFRNVLPLSLYGIFIINTNRNEELNKIINKIALFSIVVTNILITIPIGQRITFAFIPILCVALSHCINKKNFIYILPVILFEFYRLYSFYEIQKSGMQKLGNGNVIFPYETFLW